MTLTESVIVSKMSCGGELPVPKSGGFDQNKYVAQYVKENVRYKKINFNVKNESDMELLAWINGQPEKPAPYLKRLVREDMRRRTNDENV